jgi:hypothetical protein
MIFPAEKLNDPRVAALHLGSEETEFRAKNQNTDIGDF